MVNYCCVSGCGRNSRHNNHLKFYSLPKERHRQLLWLDAAGRKDLLNKEQDKVNGYRFCSRHFTPTSVKNRNLIADAVPTLHLSGSQDEDDTDNKPLIHSNIICNGCRGSILGFRYKCVTCKDYDLCQKCEMMETHPEHFVIRIPKPMKFKDADNLTEQWKELFNVEHITAGDSSDVVSIDSDSSDDEPITKYAKNYDSGIELSEDVKNIIRKEVTRALSNITEDGKKGLKRSRKKSMNEQSKRQKLTEVNKHGYPRELAFADVNQIEVANVKNENVVDIDSNITDDHQQPSHNSNNKSGILRTLLEQANIDSSDIEPYIPVSLDLDGNLKETTEQ